MSNYNKSRKFWVRFLCIFLSGLMVLGIAATGIFIIIGLIGSSGGHYHLFADEAVKTVLSGVL